MQIEIDTTTVETMLAHATVAAQLASRIDEEAVVDVVVMMSRRSRRSTRLTDCCGWWRGRMRLPMRQRGSSTDDSYSRVSRHAPSFGRIHNSNEPSGREERRSRMSNMVKLLRSWRPVGLL